MKMVRKVHNHVILTTNSIKNNAVNLNKFKVKRFSNGTIKMTF